MAGNKSKPIQLIVNEIIDFLYGTFLAMDNHDRREWIQEKVDVLLYNKGAFHY